MTKAGAKHKNDDDDDANDVDIPLICHGSHGYTRVNFFWPA